MNTVRDYLGRMHDELQQFEVALRGLIVNQNISDVVASARAKLAQAASHPDAETELEKLREKPAQLPFGGDEQHGA